MSKCPSDRDLELLLEDGLREPERASVEAHVESCAQCQSTLQRLVTPPAGDASLQIPGDPAEPVGTHVACDESAFLRRLAASIAFGSSNARIDATADGERNRRLPDVEGYELLEEIGRGAVGIVYRARHLGLNRLVALKMVLAGPFTSPKARQRFQIESQAIARLRHPRIVQVFDIGEAHGSLYLSLELVEGGNLADSIAQGPRPAVESARIVAELADAVAYAHRNGVIHRDLKPSNVLLGGAARLPAPDRERAPTSPIGELKITDFGIAKVSTEEGRTEAGVTVSGEFLGTPSYTAPEQARGDARSVGPQADVYSLGAILYELLTGRPPFRGASVVETLLQVAHHVAVPPARLVPGVPRDLDTICSKCLEKNPARRYATADALAEDLRRFLRSEPVLARRIGIPGRLLRWIRRSPARAGGIGGAILVALALTGAGLWMGMQSAALDRQVSADLQDLAGYAAVPDWAGARTSLERAKARLGDGGSAALRRRVDQSVRDLELVARLDAVRSYRAAATEGSQGARENRARADREYEADMLAAGIGRVRDDAGLVAVRLRDSQIRRALVAAFDDWAFCCADADDAGRAEWLNDVAREADADASGWIVRVRDPATWKDRATLEALTKEAIDAHASVDLLIVLAERLEGLGGDTVPFLTRVQHEHPDDFWVNLTLGDTHNRQDSKESFRYYQAATAIRPGAAVVYNNFGRALATAGSVDDAIDHFRRALRINATFAGAHSNLGLALGLLRRHDEAIAACREAVRCCPDSASFQTNLGVALAAAKRGVESVVEFERALALDPKHVIALVDLCDALRRLGRIDEAIEQGELALPLEPANPVLHDNLGAALQAKGRVREAEEHYRKSIESSPTQVLARTNLCDLLRQEGRLDEAIDFGEQALRLEPAGRAGHSTLGMALAEKGRIGEAIGHLETALAADPDRAESHDNLAIALQSAGRVDEAIEHYQQARDLDPDVMLTYGPLCIALASQERWDEAQEAADEYLERSAPNDPKRKAIEEVRALCSRNLAFAERLPGILDGSETPADAAEALQFARLCVSRKEHGGAARLFTLAFAQSPDLARDPRRADRYAAARCATMAATTTTSGAHAPDDAQRAAWRRQAREWLLAELSTWERRFADSPDANRAAALDALKHWIEEPELAGLRDDAATSGLPESEREECRALWNAVRSLRERVEPGR